MTKKTIKGHLEKNLPLFSFVDKIYGDRKLTKKKISEQEALKCLQKRFSREVKDIYGIIGNFREGLKSFEVFSQ
jgi:hypothetical protein